MCVCVFDCTKGKYLCTDCRIKCRGGSKQENTGSGNKQLKWRVKQKQQQQNNKNFKIATNCKWTHIIDKNVLCRT